jgi:hypothetical protein
MFLKYRTFYKSKSAIIPNKGQCLRDVVHDVLLERYRLLEECPALQNIANCVAFSPQVNHTDGETAADWRVPVPNFPVKGFAWSARWFHTIINIGFSYTGDTNFLSVGSSVILTRLSGPRSDPLFLSKSASAGNQTQDLWVCSHKFWPLDTEAVHNAYY